MDDKSLETLKKRAYGYTVTEQVTEYDGEGNEIKQKTTTKEVQPDMSALKMIIDLDEEDDISEVDLIKEREKIIARLEKGYMKNIKSLREVK